MTAVLRRPRHSGRRRALVERCIAADDELDVDAELAPVRTVTEPTDGRLADNTEPEDWLDDTDALTRAYQGVFGVEDLATLRIFSP